MQNNNIQSISAIQAERPKFQYHPYHMVTPSPWPLFISFSLLILTMGAVVYFQGIISPFGDSGLSLVILGLISTTLCMVLWLRDIITEGTFLGDHTFKVQKGLTLGITLFITSEAFFFLSIFWALFNGCLSPDVALGGQWPPMGIESINPFELPLLNTVLLLSSGASVTYSHHALLNKNRSGAIAGLIITILFASVFTYCQGIEYSNAPFTISDGMYGSTFYMSTGFHGIHVIVGTIMLAVSLARLIQYHFTNTHHIGYESAILYWHFVDVVWLFLFVSVYWFGG
uniref:cytochrome c oxidase subunit 3 n=1 Tax=Malassezia vespertilionis TaxID=2020962 RepID=UPI003002CF28|nr:cytochrome c oxidase subunit 3 [Malassezia vespertilionis]